MSDNPIGKPYSQVYVERGKTVEDSHRFRQRLRGYLSALPQSHRVIIARAIARETGAETYFGNVASHMTECSLADLLDNITHITGALRIIRDESSPSFVSWLRFVDRALKEENVGYVVDNAGGIHPAHDEEFDVARRSTIAALGMPRYATARQFFEQGVADLKPPQDTRDAVRRTFEAVENVAKLMAPSISRLGASEVEKVLKPLATASLLGTERDATNLMLSSMANWVNGCQQYRHAPGTPEPDPPSLELAIWMVSTGASHLRWLVGIDQKLQGS